jgi:urea transport system ATP-binding protein
MLAISDLHVAYGQSEVLHGLNVSVAPNEIVAIMGRNGMGKTTLMKSLMGIVPTKSGSVTMERRRTQRSSRATSASPRGWPMCRRAA